MCDLCRQEPCAWGCPNADFSRERKICAWCDNPIWENVYYDIDGDTVCVECVDMCRRYTYDE